MSNRLDLDQAGHCLGLVLGPNFLQMHLRFQLSITFMYERDELENSSLSQ